MGGPTLEGKEPDRGPSISKPGPVGDSTPRPPEGIQTEPVPEPVPIGETPRPPRIRSDKDQEETQPTPGRRVARRPDKRTPEGRPVSRPGEPEQPVVGIKFYYVETLPSGGRSKPWNDEAIIACQNVVMAEAFEVAA